MNRNFITQADTKSTGLSFKRKFKAQKLTKLSMKITPPLLWLLEEFICRLHVVDECGCASRYGVGSHVFHLRFPMPIISKVGSTGGRLFFLGLGRGPATYMYHIISIYTFICKVHVKQANDTRSMFCTLHVSLL